MCTPLLADDADHVRLVRGCDAADGVDQQPAADAPAAAGSPAPVAVQSKPKASAKAKAKARG